MAERPIAPGAIRAERRAALTPGTPRACGGPGDGSGLRLDMAGGTSDTGAMEITDLIIVTLGIALGGFIKGATGAGAP
ncbi:MAG: hypothetical protein AAGG09_06640, partial [Pseudomonadota bacterium]